MQKYVFRNKKTDLPNSSLLGGDCNLTRRLEMCFVEYEEVGGVHNFASKKGLQLLERYHKNDFESAEVHSVFPELFQPEISSIICCFVFWPTK